MGKFIKDFKKFAAQGNMMDMAVGVVLGTAFKDIINSFVGDVIMPALGLVIGKVNLSSLVWSPAEGIDIAYGTLIQKILDFFIIALCIFLFVRIITVLRTRADREIVKIRKRRGKNAPAPEPEPEPAPAPLTTTEQLLTDIKALLEKQAQQAERK